MMRTMLNDYLTALGAPTPSYAVSAEQALTLLRLISFDLVVCDFYLETAITGLELREMAKKQDVLLKSVIWLVVTGDSSVVRVVESLESSVDGYILKPFSVETFQERLVPLVEQRETFSDVYFSLAALDYVRAVSQLKVLQFNKGVVEFEATKQLGRIYFKQGDGPNAEKLYGDFYFKYPRLSFIMEGYARALQLNGKTEEAIKLIESNQGCFNTDNILIDLYNTQGQRGKALKVAKDSATLVPSFNNHNRVGIQAVLAGDSAAAVAAFEAAGLLNTKMPRSLDEVAMVLQAYINVGQASMASKLVDRYQPQFKGVAAEVIFLAIRVQTTKKMHRAGSSIGQLKALIKSDPNLNLTDHGLVVCLAAYSAYDYEEELEPIVQALVGRNHEFGSVLALVTPSTIRWPWAHRKVSTLISQCTEKIATELNHVEELIEISYFLAAFGAIERLLSAAPKSLPAHRLKVKILRKALDEPMCASWAAAHSATYLSIFSEDSPDLKSLAALIFELKTALVGRSLCETH